MVTRIFYFSAVEFSLNIKMIIEHRVVHLVRFVRNFVVSFFQVSCPFPRAPLSPLLCFPTSRAAPLVVRRNRAAHKSWEALFYFRKVSSLAAANVALAATASLAAATVSTSEAMAASPPPAGGAAIRGHAGRT